MYDKLVPELRDDPSGVGYAAMSDEQVAQKMLEPAGVEVVSYFAGFRTLAAILSQNDDRLRGMGHQCERRQDGRRSQPYVALDQRWRVRRADQHTDRGRRHERTWSVQDRTHGGGDRLRHRRAVWQIVNVWRFDCAGHDPIRAAA